MIQKLNIEPSKKSSKSIIIVVLAFLMFYLVYFILLFTSIGLFVGAIYLGVILLKISVNFISVIICIMLFIVSSMLLLFLTKIFFTSYKDEDPNRLRIHREDYPDLFSLIENIADQVGTKYPKEVYVNIETNSMVFYNSNFWNLFFPVTKNLELGLGLLNSINIEELKAILAHEFGHFSQKSMRLGTYFYVSNKIIYNLLYNYDYWDKLIEKGSDLSRSFGIYAQIIIVFTDNIKKLLGTVYNLAYKAYMNLSREMEYHADEFSVGLIGTDITISALRRTELGTAAFDIMTERLRSLNKKELRSENIYKNHSFYIKLLSKHNKLDLKNGLPIIPDKSIAENTIRSRVIIKNQWASHPSREEREKNMKSINSKKAFDIDERDCWNFFGDYTELQKKITKRFYESNFGELKNHTTFDNDYYKNYFMETAKKYAVDEAFNKFYTLRYLSENTLENLDNNPIKKELHHSFQEIYNKDSGNLFFKSRQDNIDLETLVLIKEKEIKTRYFEFDNHKYKQKEAQKIYDQLKYELEELDKELQKLDDKAFYFNLHVSGLVSSEKKDEYVKNYRKLIDIQNNAIESKSFRNSITNYYHIIIEKSFWYDNEIRQLNNDLRKLEEEFKSFFKKIDINLSECFPKSEIAEIKSYRESDTFYTYLITLEMDKLIQLLILIHELDEHMDDIYFAELKTFTDMQIEMYSEVGLDISFN